VLPQGDPVESCVLQAPRRLRRFCDKNGDQYDELVGGLLRRRLRQGENRVHAATWYPKPLPRAEIEAHVGALTEVNTRY
jgi:hypothetical protein